MCRLHFSLVVVLASTIMIASLANQRAKAQFGGGRGDDEPVGENRASESPKAMIALSIWILKLSESREDADAELTARIAAQTEALSPEVGSVSEVRELVGQMREAGMLRGERELRMMTLDGQPVTAQIGRNQPRILAVKSDSRSGQTSTITYEPTGTLIKAVPQIDAEEFIQVSLEIGESNTEKSTDVTIFITAEGGPHFADVVTTRQFNTTARTKNGSAVLLQHDAVQDSDDPSRDATELIILGAAIVDEEK